MSEQPTKSPPRFVTCHCEHCGGGVEFDDNHAGESVACPHCGAETTLNVPSAWWKRKFSISVHFGGNGRKRQTSVSSETEPPQKLPRPLSAVTRMGIVFACILMGVLGLLVFSILTPKIWVKSSTVQQGDVKITIEATRVNASMNPSGNLMKSDLNIIVIIENLNSTKILKYEGWSSVGKVILTDNFGNIYNKDRDLFTPPPITEYQLYPNKNAADFLSFLKPVENIQWLHLELPARNFGGSGVIRFEIPASEITIQRW